MHKVNTLKTDFNIIKLTLLPDKVVECYKCYCACVCLRARTHLSVRLSVPGEGGPQEGLHAQALN